MSNLRNGDILVVTDSNGNVREQEVVFVEMDGKILQLQEKAIKTETSISNGLTLLDEFGRTLLSKTDRELPSLGQKSMSHFVGEYRAPLDFTFSQVYESQSKGSNTRYKWRVDFSESVVRSRVSHSKKIDNEQMDMFTVIDGDASGFFLGTGTGPAHSLIFNIPLFLGTTQPCDFVPLMPFTENKSFSLSKPISFKFEDRIKQRTLIKSDTEPSVTEKNELLRGTASGNGLIEISLTEKIQHPVSDDESVEAFRFKCTFLSEYKTTGKHEFSGNIMDAPEKTRKMKLTSTGVIAFLGIPVILELDEHQEYEEDGTEYDLDFVTSTEIRRIERPKEIQQFNTESIYDSIAKVEGSIQSAYETASIPESKHDLFVVDVQPKTPETDSSSPEEAPASPERVADDTKKKEGDSQGSLSTRSKELEVETEESSAQEKPVTTRTSPTKREAAGKPIEVPESRPARDWLHSEEISQWNESIAAARQFFEKTITTPKDLVKYLKANEQQLKVNPIARKAFLSHISRTFGVKDSRILDELEMKPDELLDQPIDYIKEILDECTQGMSSEDSFDWQSQQEKDLERLETEYDETLDELEESLRDSVDAWDDVLSHFKPELQDQPIGILKEFLKVPGGLEDFIGRMELLSDSFKAITSTEHYLQIRDKLKRIENMMTLVRDGILVNPSL